MAARLGVPSVAVANFTWDWIYETHPGFLPAGAPALDRIRAAYRKAALALRAALRGRIRRLPARRPDPADRAATGKRSRAATRAHFGLPDQGRVALLSFGGYGMPLARSRGLVDCRSTGRS